jgi:hypothetical protein
MIDLPQSIKRSNRLDNNELFDSETENESIQVVTTPTRVPFYKKIPFFKPLLIIIFTQFFLFFLFTFVISKDQALSILKTCENIFISQYNSNFLVFLVFYFILCLISIACVIPTISVVVILLTVVSKSITQTWTITMINYLIIESSLYFIFNKSSKYKIASYVRKFG